MREVVREDGRLQFLGNWHGIEINGLDWHRAGFRQRAFIYHLIEGTGTRVRWAQAYDREVETAFIEPFQEFGQHVYQALIALKERRLDAWIKEVVYA